MPTTTVNGLAYDYEEKGSGLPIVFAHGLTFDRHMWDHQVEALSPRYRCIAYDFLGHRGSPTHDPRRAAGTHQRAALGVPGAGGRRRPEVGAVRLCGGRPGFSLAFG